MPSMKYSGRKLLQLFDIIMSEDELNENESKEDLVEPLSPHASLEAQIVYCINRMTARVESYLINCVSNDSHISNQSTSTPSNHQNISLEHDEAKRLTPIIKQILETKGNKIFPKLREGYLLDDVTNGLALCGLFYFFYPEDLPLSEILTQESALFNWESVRDLLAQTLPSTNNNNNNVHHHSTDNFLLAFMEDFMQQYLVPFHHLTENNNSREQRNIDQKDYKYWYETVKAFLTSLLFYLYTSCLEDIEPKKVGQHQSENNAVTSLTNIANNSSIYGSNLGSNVPIYEDPNQARPHDENNRYGFGNFSNPISNQNLAGNTIPPYNSMGENALPTNQYNTSRFSMPPLSHYTTNLYLKNMSEYDLTLLRENQHNYNENNLPRFPQNNPNFGGMPAYNYTNPYHINNNNYNLPPQLKNPNMNCNNNNPALNPLYFDSYANNHTNIPPTRFPNTFQQHTYPNVPLGPNGFPINDYASFYHNNGLNMKLGSYNNQNFGPYNPYGGPAGLISNTDFVNAGNNSNLAQYHNFNNRANFGPSNFYNNNQHQPNFPNILNQSTMYDATNINNNNENICNKPIHINNSSSNIIRKAHSMLFRDPHRTNNVRNNVLNNTTCSDRSSNSPILSVAVQKSVLKPNNYNVQSKQNTEQSNSSTPPRINNKGNFNENHNTPYYEPLSYHQQPNYTPGGKESFNINDNSANMSVNNLMSSSPKLATPLNHGDNNLTKSLTQLTIRTSSNKNDNMTSQPDHYYESPYQGAACHNNDGSANIQSNAKTPNLKQNSNSKMFANYRDNRKINQEQEEEIIINNKNNVSFSNNTTMTQDENCSDELVKSSKLINYAKQTPYYAKNANNLNLNNREKFIHIATYGEEQIMHNFDNNVNGYNVINFPVPITEVRKQLSFLALSANKQKNGAKFNSENHNIPDFLCQPEKRENFGYDQYANYEENLKSNESTSGYSNERNCEINSYHNNKDSSIPSNASPLPYLAESQKKQPKNFITPSRSVKNLSFTIPLHNNNGFIDQNASSILDINNTSINNKDNHEESSIFRKRLSLSRSVCDLAAKQRIIPSSPTHSPFTSNNNNKSLITVNVASNVTTALDQEFLEETIKKRKENVIAKVIERQAKREIQVAKKKELAAKRAEKQKKKQIEMEQKKEDEKLKRQIILAQYMEKKFADTNQSSTQHKAITEYVSPLHKSHSIHSNVSATWKNNSSVEKNPTPNDENKFLSFEKHFITKKDQKETTEIDDKAANILYYDGKNKESIYEKNKVFKSVRACKQNEITRIAGNAKKLQNLPPLPSQAKRMNQNAETSLRRTFAKSKLSQSTYCLRDNNINNNNNISPTPPSSPMTNIDNAIKFEQKFRKRNNVNSSLTNSIKDTKKDFTDNGKFSTKTGFLTKRPLSSSKSQYSLCNIAENDEDRIWDRQNNSKLNKISASGSTHHLCQLLRLEQQPQMKNSEGNNSEIGDTKKFGTKINRSQTQKFNHSSTYKGIFANGNTKIINNSSISKSGNKNNFTYSSTHSIPTGGNSLGENGRSGPSYTNFNGEKNNRAIVIQALTHSVLAGMVNAQIRMKAIEAINKSDQSQFIILFRDRQMQYRALYHRMTPASSSNIGPFIANVGGPMGDTTNIFKHSSSSVNSLVASTNSNSSKTFSTRRNNALNTTNALGNGSNGLAIANAINSSFAVELVKIHGLGPQKLIADHSTVAHFYKYNSGSKAFIEIPSKQLTATIDAIIVKEIVWQTCKISRKC